MRNYVKGAVLYILAVMIALSLSFTALAASPKKIAIRESLSRMTVGQKAELDSKITPAGAKVRDKKIVWTSSNPKVIRVLEKYDDDTEIKALKEGTATITVRIKGTSWKASRKITVTKGTQASASSYEKKIKKYQAELKEIESSMKKASAKSGYQARRQQAAAYDAKIEKIEDKLDDLEDAIERLYDTGGLSGSQYKKLERRLEEAEDYASELEDYLEDKFGDFDD